MSQVEANDRLVVNNILQIMLTLKIEENVSSKKYIVTKEENAYIIRVDFPSGIPFKLSELKRIEHSNPVLVKEVWIYYNSDTISIYASVFMTGGDWKVEGKTIMIIETTSSSTGFDKKRRINE